jgi:Flp pilus assembly pilin Flp
VDWIYGWQGWMHAELADRINRMGRSERGQGTVEYVGLILLVAVILAGVVKASGGLKDSTIAEAVVKKLKGAIDSVGEGQ